MHCISAHKATGGHVFELTAKDEEIVLALTTKIRVATLSQLSRTWWNDTPLGRESALRRANRLVQAGVLDVFLLRAHPELPLAEPVWSWKPGEPPAPFGILSFRVRKRWCEPLRPTTVYVASAKTARQFAGSGGRLSHPLQVTHDLHVSALFLGLLKNRPAEAERWVSENVLAPLRKRQKLPDAEIHDETGRVLKVIEFAGSYPTERIRLVHEDCERRQVPYELW